MTAVWAHSPETEEYAQAWRLWEAGRVVALVVMHAPGLYSACIYPLGKSRQVGDVYASAPGAKSACVRQLRKAGVIE